MKSADKIKSKINEIRKSKALEYIFRKGNVLYVNGQIVPLLQSDKYDDFQVFDQYDDFKVRQNFDEEFSGQCSCNSHEICPHRVAALLHIQEYLAREEKVTTKPGIIYTREGMIKRVLTERFSRAKQAKYSLQLSENLYGEHILYNEKGKAYRITFHDFKTKTGYCSCPDFQTNKLGTCKHLIWAFKKVAANQEAMSGKSKEFPFVEVYLNPMNDYKISWYFPGRVPEPELSAWLYRYFDENLTLIPDKEADFHLFLDKASEFKQLLIRPEVYGKVEKIQRKQLLSSRRKSVSLDYSVFQRQPYSFQKKGIEFLTFREKALLADEIGLGKTYQAIAAAWFKHIHLGFKRCLIVCPASLISHWSDEILHITGQDAVWLSRPRPCSQNDPAESDAYFYIINYEKLTRENYDLPRCNFQTLIIDEIQRLRNFHTKTTAAVQSLQIPHIIGLSGLPVASRLTDLYAILSILDPEVVAPLWEFSYKHYYFDSEQDQKITGYHHLDELAASLGDIVLRRTRREVLKDLPSVIRSTIQVYMDDDQASFQDEQLKWMESLLQKKFLTPYDWQSVFRGITKLRMLADSAFLNHKETAGMPKLTQLRELLINKLNIKAEKRKVVIFSEWKGVILRVAKLLREESIRFVELHGDIPINRRPEILKEFAENPQCHVFLSSETGGTGLNLQMADLIINIDLPWTEQQLLQRIGRIERLGQEAHSLQIINLVSVPSIESQLAEMQRNGDTGLADLFNRRTETPGEVELQPQLEKIRRLVASLLHENYSRDLSLNLFSETEQFDSYSVEIQSVIEPEDNEKTEDLTGLLFGQIEARLAEVQVITEQLDWLGRFYQKLKGKELYEGEPQVEFLDNELIIRIKLKND